MDALRLEGPPLSSKSSLPLPWGGQGQNPHTLGQAPHLPHLPYPEPGPQRTAPRTEIAPTVQGGRLFVHLQSVPVPSQPPLGHEPVRNQDHPPGGTEARGSTGGSGGLRGGGQSRGGSGKGREEGGEGVGGGQPEPRVSGVLRGLSLQPSAPQQRAQGHAQARPRV